MNLDVVIPTHNRSARLRRAVESALTCTVPVGCTLLVTVVDNNSNDDTKAVATELAQCHKGRVSYLFEGRQGSSSARNAAIRATSGEILAFFDDDETVTPQWLECIVSTFASLPDADCITGPCLPDWECEIPQWLPPAFPGVVGWNPGPGRLTKLNIAEGLYLLGGNCALRRSALGEDGFFNTQLGRTDRGLLSAEDLDFSKRLLNFGKVGYWVPELIVRHAVPASRCTRKYHRSWSYWNGVSCGSTYRAGVTGPSLLGLPRWMFGLAAASTIKAASGYLLHPKESGPFEAELRLWNFVGHLVGRHFWKPTPT